MATRSLITEYVKDTDGNYNSVEIHPITDSASVLTTTTQESGKNYGSYTGLPLETGSTSTQETVLQSLLKTRSRLYELRAFNGVTINTSGWKTDQTDTSVPSSGVLFGAMSAIANTLTTMSGNITKADDKLDAKIDANTESINNLRGNVNELNTDLTNAKNTIDRLSPEFYGNKELELVTCWNDAYDDFPVSIEIPLLTSVCDDQFIEHEYYKITTFSGNYAKSAYEALNTGKTNTNDYVHNNITLFNHAKVAVFDNFSAVMTQSQTWLLYTNDSGADFTKDYAGLETFIHKWGCNISYVDEKSSQPSHRITYNGDSALTVIIEKYKNYNL